jgi:hypothetical protein
MEGPLPQPAQRIATVKQASGTETRMAVNLIWSFTT